MNLGFAIATTRWGIAPLFVVYGLFYSIDEAQSKAFIADIETERRATAIGTYDFVAGAIYLPASLTAGAFWLMQPTKVFVLAALFSLVASAAFIFLCPAQHESCRKPGASHG